MKVYTVGYRDPLPRITKGKLVLIGDAAHPMLPSTPPHANWYAKPNELTLEQRTLKAAAWHSKTPPLSKP